MKDLSYGKGYDYDHDADRFSGQNYFRMTWSGNASTSRSTRALKPRSRRASNGGSSFEPSVQAKGDKAGAVEQRAVTADEADIRLDRWFKRHFPTLGHGRLQKLLRTGRVRVDGKRAQANARLAEGHEQLEYRHFPTAMKPSRRRPPSRQDADELRA